MAEYGPFAGDPATDPSANLGEDFYMNVLAPEMLDAGLAADTRSTAGQVHVVSASATALRLGVRGCTAVARGVGYRESVVKTVDFAAASSSGARTDRVVLRFDRNTNTVGPAVITGNVGAAAPAITRTADVYDVRLAQVTIGRNATGFASDGGAIKDDREFSGLRIIPALAGVRPPTPRRGQPIYEEDTNRFVFWNGSTWANLDQSPIRTVPADVLLGAVPPAGTQLTHHNFTAVIFVQNAAGGFNVGFPEAKNALVNATMNLGDATADLVIPILANHTMKSLGGKALIIRDGRMVALPAGSAVRLSVDVTTW